MKNERTIETQKIIFNYIIKDNDLDKFVDYHKGDAFFDSKPIDLVFKTIIDLYKSNDNKVITDKKIILSSIDEKESSVNKEILDSLFNVDYSQLSRTYLDVQYKSWMEDYFSRVFFSQVIDDMKNGNKSKVYKLYEMTKSDFDIDLEEEKNLRDTPTIDDKVYSLLPSTLKEIFINFKDKRERDVVLMSSLSSLSVLFPHIWTIWESEKDRCNMYSFVAANAASGKGKMNLVQDLMKTYVDNEIKQNELKDLEYNEKVENGEKRVSEPVYKYTMIPGDSSTAAFREKLKYNDGRGLIFVTEADDIIAGKKQDWGNYDTMLRLAFHNETISSNRKGEKMDIIQNPHISASLSGTFDQVVNMFDGRTENGLLSRFMFYIFEGDEKWRKRGELKQSEIFDIKEKLQGSSEKIFKTYESLINKDVEIKYTKEQVEYIDDTFDKLFDIYVSFFGNQFSAIVKRMAVIMRKILMVLSAFRITEITNKKDKFLDILNSGVDFDIQIPSSFIAFDDDLYNAVSIVKTLLKHNSMIFNHFKETSSKKEVKIKTDPLIDKYMSIGDDFTYDEFVEGIDVNYKKVQRYLKNMVEKGKLIRVQKGEYKKIIK